jgi:hypothetical protein
VLVVTRAVLSSENGNGTISPVVDEDENAAILSTAVNVTDLNFPRQHCSPLLPSDLKRSRLQRYQTGLTPLMFWHLQKAGGSSICAMFVKEHKYRNLSASKGDNCNGPWQELLDGYKHTPPTAGATVGNSAENSANNANNANNAKSTVFQIPYPGFMVGMEPGHNWAKKFPRAYHTRMGGLLRPAASAESDYRLISEQVCTYV